MLLKVSDVAKRLNLSASKVYQLIEQNRLPHHRLDGAIRISEEQLAGYLESTRCERTEPQALDSPAFRPRLKHVRL
jgi:excisionase family DNA binding protein